MIQTATLDALKACLDAGGYVVCSMGPGYWTKGGHFICAWKYDDKYIYCNDPASSTRKKQNTSDFMAQRKQFFCYYPDPKEGEKDGNTDADNRGGNSNSADRQPVKRGSKIVDISKYQPYVDYDAFIADTALIIFRAGYRGTGGSIKKDQKLDTHADELRKRGVRFGVYFYSIADTEENAQEEARMFWKYAKDYDPLFWAMDAEKDSITTAAIVALVDELRKLGAVKVGCYVANHLHNKYYYSSIREQMDFTWIPRYSKTKPVYPCDLWQYTSTGSVAGISGNVDLNKITGEGKSLDWFCGR
jgi:GH25 family lysozyme M1 (1,4-beta-N-acetylmuramidase)